ncbi:DoxX family protein [Rhizobium sp. BK251]|uniref:DoxX family protein n=1 Tax=Rhizobium sp. BK251 TaxID=2512125 RepID=UPI001042AB7F|nr:DoxX family protein [Rhizobium sp. BK251]TCL64661.1 putative oxidoreductase [Rhizobium sp. BK251]
MTMMNTTQMAPTGGVAGLYFRVLQLADRVPLSLVQLISRLAVAQVFWQSSQSKLASWPVTTQLFAMEYRLPFIDPGIAAVMATAAELTGAILILLGAASRLAALMLLGVIATIQTFVYPENWPDHLLWTAPLLLILFRGPGAISLDHLAATYFIKKGL